MQSTLQDSLFAAAAFIGWNGEPNSLIQVWELAILIVLTVADISPSPYKTTSEYLTDGWPVPVAQASFGHFPCDTNPAYQEEKAKAMSGFPSPVVPIDIPSVQSVDASFTSLAIMRVPLGSSSSSLSLASSLGDSMSCGNWHLYPGIPGTVGQGCYSTVMGQGSIDDYHSSGSPPGGLSFDGNLAIPPGLGVNASTAGAMDTRPGHYGTTYWDGSAQRPVSKRQKNERPASQPVGQGAPDRRFTCTVDNCGKDFSGEWEKARHIKSIHGPPTIGCRECNYKQSRKDLFSEHCRKRHPGESIDGLMVDLVTTPE